jgi:hypothetical protein
MSAMPGGRGWRSIAPRWLDPILVIAEHVNRGRLHIRPIRPDGIVGLELARYQGRPRQLADGTRIEARALIGKMHFRNDRLRAVATAGWQREGWRIAQADMAALARWWLEQPEATRPVAFRAMTIHGPLAARAGFELYPRSRTPKMRLDDWWMRWLLNHYGLAGRARLRRGHGRLESVDAWLSPVTLVARYGSSPDGALRRPGRGAGT